MFRKNFILGINLLVLTLLITVIYNRSLGGFVRFYCLCHHAKVLREYNAPLAYFLHTHFGADWIHLLLSVIELDWQ